VRRPKKLDSRFRPCAGARRRHALGKVDRALPGSCRQGRPPGTIRPVAATPWPRRKMANHPRPEPARRPLVHDSPHAGHPPNPGRGLDAAILVERNPSPPIVPCKNPGFGDRPKGRWKRTSLPHRVRHQPTQSGEDEFPWIPVAKTITIGHWHRGVIPSGKDPCGSAMPTVRALEGTTSRVLPGGASPIPAGRGHASLDWRCCAPASLPHHEYGGRTQRFDNQGFRCTHFHCPFIPTRSRMESGVGTS